MGRKLNEIAQELKNNTSKVQLIYAFNGTGKTRLSNKFKNLIYSINDDEIGDVELENRKILYYNAFTEDLFYWDNDILNGVEPKLKIHHNNFTKWIFEDQGQDRNIVTTFQHYTDKKLTPHFNAEYTSTKDIEGNFTVPAFSEVMFSYERGNDENLRNIKISKGEESCFIWSIFYSLLVM